MSMTDKLEYKQGKIGWKRHFSLEDTYFNYLDADESSSIKKKIFYLSLPEKDKFYENKESNMFAFIMGICFILVGAVQYVAMEILTGKPKFTMATIGVIAFLFYFYNKTNFIAIPTDDGVISIACDGSENKIIDSLYSKRNAVLKSNYAYFNEQATFESEIDKYNYLLKEGAIDEVEYEELKNKAYLYHGIETSKEHLNG
jgi:hypothetical protein